MSAIDFGRHSDDYAAARPGLPASFFDRLNTVTPIDGSRALDLATGPGTVALDLAQRGSDVTAVDISPELIEAARRLAGSRNLSERVHFEIARAESTGLESDAFDLVTAAQCWHWFDSDSAMAETRRVLRPGGHLAIIYYSYLAPYNAVASDTEMLVLEFNPTWTRSGSTGVFPDLIDALIRSDLSFVEAICYDHPESFSHEKWRRRMRTSNGVGSGGLPPDEVTRFDKALGDLLAARYPDPVTVEHRLWCVIGRKRV